MKSVLISIQPYWVFLIIAKLMGWEIDKNKIIEVRKNFPKAEDWNKLVKIYCSKDKDSFNQIPKKYQPLMQKFLGKVIGEFVCDRIDKIGKRGIYNNFDYCYLSLNEWGNDDIEIEITDIKNSCIPKEKLNFYGANSHCLYGWHISDLKIYDKPKELNEFYGRKKCNSCMCGYESSACIFDEDCKVPYKITRPPQSWCYVEEN